ncbi:peptidyl-prolyl cis-trans isomerase [Striga asiatica]|uniref:peptidylprolyl isomerase n=1 Tax=Striga asiatica TaxID=4170 RepID=A0A5A7R8N3_STRAF|nr:peptidyl-prolyl cis-trans isomerase [Striga asiatica]
MATGKYNLCGEEERGRTTIDKWFLVTEANALPGSKPAREGSSRRKIGHELCRSSYVRQKLSNFAQIVPTRRAQLITGNPLTISQSGLASDERTSVLTPYLNFQVHSVSTIFNCPHSHLLFTDAGSQLGLFGVGVVVGFSCVFSFSLPLFSPTKSIKYSSHNCFIHIAYPIEIVMMILSLKVPQLFMENLPKDESGPPKVDTKVEVLHENVTKQIIKEGHGQKPSKYSTCFLHYRAWTESTQHKFEDTWREQQLLELILGKEKKEMTGMAIGISCMKSGERALLHVGWELGYGKEGSFSFPNVPPMADIVYEVELIGFDETKEGKARGDMTVEERIGAADRRKMDGNALFNEDKLEEAMQQYEMVKKALLSFVYPFGMYKG